MEANWSRYLLAAASSGRFLSWKAAQYSSRKRQSSSHMALRADRRPLAQPPVPDGKVDELLETGKCTLGTAFFPGLERLQDTGSLAADVGHLLRETQFGPTAIFQRPVLHLCSNEFID